ncbi:MAG TPA: FAD:protein FMN transferase, partial [Acidimicrobiales bacterium]|nr:FAD:protein FMN transferase [Acidimicrobiales bacterium]
KGWAAARALGPLRAAGVAGAMVNAGGDIALLGEPTPGSPWRIGIRHPDDPHRLVRVISTRSAVATSGTYERGEHLVDPRSGQSASPVAAATVVGPDLGWADGLATGLVVAGRPGLDAIEQLDGYSAMLVGRDGGVTVTGGFPPDVGEAPAGRTSGDG